jgi:hypothetical protein
MKLKTKTRLANISIWTIVVTISLVALFFFGFLISESFNLKVFTQDANDFIWILFAASMVIVLCGAFLNISLNIGIIADSKISEAELLGQDKSKFNLIFLLVFLGTLILITGILFFGDFRTRLLEKKKLIAECNEIVERYDKSIKDMSISLVERSKITEIPDILKFLSEQKSEFPSIILITSDFYKEQLTFLEITEYSDKKDLVKKLYDMSFYSCNKNDCEYLKEIFSTESTDDFFWTEKNDYKYYLPITDGQKKYVLLFSKYDRYGKYGK